MRSRSINVIAAPMPIATSNAIHEKRESQCSAARPRYYTTAVVPPAQHSAPVALAAKNFG